MFELLFLLGIGLILIKLSFLCLGKYQEQFASDPKSVVFWELIVQSLGAGTSWGRMGVILFLVGSFFCVMSAYIFLQVVFAMM